MKKKIAIDKLTKIHKFSGMTECFVYDKALITEIQEKVKR